MEEKKGQKTVVELVFWGGDNPFVIGFVDIPL